MIYDYIYFFSVDTIYFLNIERKSFTRYPARMTTQEFIADDEPIGPEVPNEDRSLREMLDSRNNEGKTALHIACEEGRLDVAQILIAYGSDLNLVDNEGHTPQSLAARSGRDNILAFLATLSAEASE